MVDFDYCLLVLLLLLTWSVAFMVKKERSQSIALIVCVVVLAFFLGSRGFYVGKDTYAYRDYYDLVKTIPLSKVITSTFTQEYYFTLPYSLGYNLFAKALSYIFRPNTTIIVAASLLYMYGMYRFLSTQTKNYPLSTFIFLALGTYLIAFNVLRQTLAVSICMLAYVAYQEGKIRKSILLTVLAASFHISALLFFILFIYEKIQPNKKNFLSLTYGIIGTGVLGFFLCKPVLTLLHLYDRYLAQGFLDYNPNPMKFVLWIGLLGIIIYLYQKETDPLPKDQFIIWSFIIIHIVLNMIALQIGGFVRLSWYFQPFIILLLDQCASKIPARFYKTYVILVIIGSILYFLGSTLAMQYAIYHYWWL